ncbi:hypothetical protein [Ferrimonas aestuarii]|uniref:hypothetical protein n=1 Tax=Ferrimonas aestuarii TaxID=2569539 RepID=UPI00145E0F0D|nr:hypothetical protein [Ferrimonas aestuarii]
MHRGLYVLVPVMAIAAYLTQGLWQAVIELVGFTIVVALITKGTATTTEAE